VTKPNLSYPIVHPNGLDTYQTPLTLSSNLHQHRMYFIKLVNISMNTVGSFIKTKQNYMIIRFNQLQGITKLWSFWNSE
jgi:hypothetical protein